MAKAESLDFDPRSDVRCVADLVRFPDVSTDLRDVRVERLVPKGIRERTPQVFESGGTTGRPKRIVDFTAWDEEAIATNTALDEHAFPAQGNWLYVGPTGPHVMAYIVSRVARLRAGAVLSLDFDPRWVKKALRAGQRSVAEAYVAHIVEQAHDILQDQQIATAVFTPPILIAAARRTRLVRLLDRVSGHHVGRHQHQPGDAAATGSRYLPRHQVRRAVRQHRDGAPRCSARGATTIPHGAYSARSTLAPMSMWSTSPIPPGWLPMVRAAASGCIA
ncbi:hypothetical protein [Nocardia terpenica]|uniref:AMP-dependent synthetase/ligase domain-containing protein n=1 Tax=Nocardia terpenica TaxID=455432 RepID=A0A291RGL6_9NOCA|nr:hypothetical protein [Nocardia terpenica]ATL66232.1 hypothetical protein CRH09_08490 [Nocardia terpenica]